jgi:hypothetical protein
MNGNSCNTMAGSAIRPQGQIEQQANDITNSIDQLGNALNRLEDRLHLALMCPPPQCGAEACKEEAVVPMADVLRMNRRRIDSLRDHVESLLCRLEL